MNITKNINGIKAKIYSRSKYLYELTINPICEEMKECLYVNLFIDDNGNIYSGQVFHKKNDVINCNLFTVKNNKIKFH